MCINIFSHQLKRSYCVQTDWSEGVLQNLYQNLVCHHMYEILHIKIYLWSIYRVVTAIESSFFSVGKQESWLRVAILIACYSLCSSMMLIFNKMAVTYIPTPSFNLACQLGSNALVVKGMAIAGTSQVEPLRWGKAKKFSLVVFAFVGSLFASVTSLKVFVPLYVSKFERLIMQQVTLADNLSLCQTYKQETSFTLLQCKVYFLRVHCMCSTSLSTL